MAKIIKASKEKISFGKRKKVKGKKLKALHESRPNKTPLIGEKQKQRKSQKLKKELEAQERTRRSRWPKIIAAAVMNATFLALNAVNSNELSAQSNNNSH